MSTNTYQGPLQRTEEEFRQMINDVHLEPTELAVLRKDCGLPYDEDALHLYTEHRYNRLGRALQLCAWGKVNNDVDED